MDYLPCQLDILESCSDISSTCGGGITDIGIAAQGISKTIGNQKKAIVFGDGQDRGGLEMTSEEKMTFVKTWQFITLMLASFSLSLSMTHLLELPQRMQFDQQLWVRVTVVENVYKLFGTVGAAFEIIVIILSFLVRNRVSRFYSDDL